MVTDNMGEKEISRRHFLVRTAQIGLGVGAASALASCAPPATPAPTSTIPVPKATPAEGDREFPELPPGWLKPVKIGLAMHVTGVVFCVPIMTAFEDVCRMLPNIEEYAIVGPETLDPARQIADFETLVEKGYDGIAAIMADPEAFIAPTQAAIEKGIQVVTTDADAPDSGRHMFFGVDWVSAGATLGDLGARALGGAPGKAVLFDCCPGATSNETRRTNCEKRLKELGVEIADTIALSTEEGENYSGIESYMTGHPDVNLLVGGCAYDTSNAGEYVKNSGNKDLKVVGWDALPKTLELIKAGWIQGTINCNPYGYGWKCAMALWENIVLGVPWPDLPNQFYPTGVEVVDASNIDTVYGREMRFYE